MSSTSDTTNAAKAHEMMMANVLKPVFKIFHKVLEEVVKEITELTEVDEEIARELEEHTEDFKRECIARMFKLHCEAMDNEVAVNWMRDEVKEIEDFVKVFKGLVEKVRKARL